MEEMKTDNLLFAELYGSSILTMDSNFNIEWFMVFIFQPESFIFFLFSVHTFYALLFYYLFFYAPNMVFFLFAVSEHRIGKIFEKLSTRDFKRYTDRECVLVWIWRSFIYIFFLTTI